MNQTIYLIGQISSAAAESYEWRKRVRDYFSNEGAMYHKPILFNIIDPCHNEFNKSVKTELTTRDKVYETAGVDLIVPKDRMAVKRSSICFANFHRYDPNKALIGTMFELAWYADSTDKAVIGIFDGDHMTDEYCRHPFVRNAVHTWVKDELEACKLSERYFTD
jgi:hypothetical protein